VAFSGESRECEVGEAEAIIGLALIEALRRLLRVLESVFITVCCCLCGLGLQMKAHSSGVRWRAFVTWKM